MAKLKFAVCGTFVKSLGHRRRIADAVAKRGYGAMAARLTPDQKVVVSNLSVLTFRSLAVVRKLGSPSDITLPEAGLEPAISSLGWRRLIN